jgi:hypothetical protein
MSLVFQQEHAGPCTHALVIGVGHYPKKGWGIGDIDSAALSAMKFASWLQQSFAANTIWPLSTVDLLVSHPLGTRTWDGPPPIDVERATTANVFRAINEWFARCDTDERNLAVLYFAGHGVEKGLVSSLLTEDFGAAPLDIGDDSLNLNVFAAGMERCRARRQWFIIDACRNTPPPLIGVLAQFGRPGVAPDANAAPWPTERDHIIHRATGASGVAWGKPGEASRFTRALVSALDGAAWDDDNDPWTSWSVRAERLVTVVNHLLSVEERLYKAPPQRARAGGDNGGFILMQPTRPPKVPVFVTCDPAHRMNEAELAVDLRGARREARQKGATDIWAIALEAVDAAYTLTAAFDQGPVTAEFKIRPPSKEAGVRAP